MQVEHGMRDVLDHAADDSGFHHPQHGELRRQRCEIELIDSRAGREEELEIGKALRDVARRLPGSKVLHLQRITDFRPDPEVDFWRLAQEDFGPLPAACRIGLVQKSGGASAKGLRNDGVQP